ncbi:cytochrome b5 reductase 4 isoform X2 [Agrilus planipennis]|uniref:Cytochrome b5 reductase 4 n=1 Tax=Agrilus planipennis TaxID=224129 RepID=A0A7F5RMV2_AGRPL|nr:cytochrome b5 reductase 4 isoform X2 [Agrilus planipennis]
MRCLNCCCWKSSSVHQEGDEYKKCETRNEDKGGSDTSEKDSNKNVECDNEGNPRNKHALSPGHSLMDWIRLGNSGTDLTGVGSQAGRLSVTHKELARHNKETDAWLAIRGKVFNITHYIPYHPGGPEEIMKGAGTDATKLFEQVHAWVNYESLLQKCYIGRLVVLDPKMNAEELFFGSPKTPKQQDTNGNKPKSVVDTIKSPGSDENDSISIASESRTKFARKADSSDDIKYLKDRMFQPRFDWIQKTDYITIVFYTKALCNPQVEIIPQSQDNVVFVYLTYECQVFTNEITFSKSIHWPCHTKVHFETGKIEIIFKKTESKIWESYGSLKQKRDDIERADNVRTHYSLKCKKDINYNTALFELERVDNGKVIVPLGKHVKIYGVINGEEVCRCYTPIPRSLFADYRPQLYATDNICLAIKRYEDGNISKYVHNKTVGDVLDVSKGIGSFCLKDLESKEVYLLLAAGTGITPMLSLLIFLIERRIRRCQKVLLVFFNQTEKDILFHDEFNSLSKIEKRFKLMNVLSNPESTWSGLKGHVSAEVLGHAIETVLDGTAFKQNDIFAMVCGPTVFTQLTEKLLKETGFDKDQIHLFLS